MMNILKQIILFLICVTLLAEDLNTYLGATLDMVKEGRYIEANLRYKWFHDHALEHNPSMAGVRLSFALGYWKQLGDVYPPALEAMQQVRDEKTSRIREGEGDFRLFHDVYALNRTLEEDQKTLDLFYVLDQKQIGLAKQCWDIVETEIIKRKDKSLIIKYAGEPRQAFQENVTQYEMNLELAKTNPNIGTGFLDFSRTHFIEETQMIIELALLLDDYNAAEEIRTSAYAVVNDPSLANPLLKE